MRHYVFDGSWAGLLTAVFHAFERKEAQLRLVHRKQYQPQVFGDDWEILADPPKAERVGIALRKEMQEGFRQQLYRAFLSEQAEAYDAVFQLIRRFFAGERSLAAQLGDPIVLQVLQIAHSVSREAHRMKAFVRFALAEDAWYVAVIEPDFNVLPLVAPFFRNRYADQQWMIYDLRRHYGLLYDLNMLTEVQLAEHSNNEAALLQPIRLHPNEQAYQKLWQAYFQHTSIAARKNLRLHVQHVPRRYWKYLPEKQYALE